MSATPKKSSEAEDVLEFLNSLPENNNGNDDNNDRNISSSFKPKSKNKIIKSGGNNDSSDILDFLDELEKTESHIKDKESKKKIMKMSRESLVNDDKEKDSIKKDSKEDIRDSEIKKTKSVVDNDNDDDDDDNDDDLTGVHMEESRDEINNDYNDDFIDPIASISNWWSSSGSQTVNSFWNNAVSITNKASEEATKLTNMEDIESKLNLKPLQFVDDKAKSLLNSSKDPIKLLSKNISNITNNVNNVLNSLNKVDEVLTIYVIHDLINFENLNDIIFKNFEKVLDQVQGNIDINIVKLNSAGNYNYRNTHNRRNSEVKRFNLFEGKLIDGEKLAFVNLESSIQSVVKYEETSKDKEKESMKSNSSSKLFISVLPIRQIKNNDEIEQSQSSESDTEIETIDQNSSNSFNFTIILKDISHNINIISRSQAFPTKWIKWLEGDNNTKNNEKKTTSNNDNETNESNDDNNDDDSQSSDGEVDPSEWVREWIDDGLALTIGVLAQSYVVKRMGY